MASLKEELLRLLLIEYLKEEVYLAKIAGMNIIKEEV